MILRRRVLMLGRRCVGVWRGLWDIGCRLMDLWNGSLKRLCKI
jgi:hypothetical protein